MAAPPLSLDALPWLLGVLGGVGGTVTLLSYGYWIREAGRAGEAGPRACRLDLGVAYAATAVFGMAMIVIGTRMRVESSGADVALRLADQLGAALGPGGGGCSWSDSGRRSSPPVRWARGEARRICSPTSWRTDAGARPPSGPSGRRCTGGT
jgi:hypothetical protein